MRNLHSRRDEKKAKSPIGAIPQNRRTEQTRREASSHHFSNKNRKKRNTGVIFE